MTIVLQIILILIALVAVIVLLSNRTSHKGRAWKKICLALLAALMIVAVLWPESTNYVASLVGVGRGADLLLYATVAAFILYALNSYLQYQDQRDATYRLARRIAIIEARESNQLK